MNQPCPFCGTQPNQHYKLESLWYCPKFGCPLYCNYMRIEQWENRVPSDDQQELARTAGEAIKAVAIAIKGLEGIAWTSQEGQSISIALKALTKIKQLSKE